jgi:Fe-S cluster assembly protein SufD
MPHDSVILDQLPAASTSRSRALLGGPLHASALPPWFLEQQSRAWQQFEELPMPVRKDPAWRFSSVDRLDLSPYLHATPLASQDEAAVLEQSRGLEQVSARLVFADNQLIQKTSLPDKLRERGVICQPLERAMVEHPDLFRKYFMSQPATLGSAKFSALHQAFVSSGTFLFVPRGVEIEQPIEIFHWLCGENAALFPHLLLVTDELAKVTVIEHFRSLSPAAPGFACGVNDLSVGPGARVTYVCAQNWGEQVRALQMNTTLVDHGASALSLNVNLGAHYSRFEGLSRLTGEDSRSDLLAVCIADGDQEFDARTLQDHASPHTASDLLFKNALDDRARTIFGGLIRVEPHAHFTDAYQKVRNLLLSDEAEADSMPGLEILADNVKCSHGATTGQIDKDEMFYLRARGIPPSVARRLLVAGFLNEVIERLRHPAIAAHLHDLIEAKFAHK